MKLISTLIGMCFLVGSTTILAEGGGGAGAGAADAVAPTPQLMEQKMLGKPEIAGDGITNATQVDDPSEIGRSDATAADAPVPAPVEGEVGAMESK